MNMIYLGRKDYDFTFSPVLYDSPKPPFPLFREACPKIPFSSVVQEPPLREPT